MGRSDLFHGRISTPRLEQISQMFERHGYTEEDVDDFFKRDRMDRRFAREKEEIRQDRARRERLKALEPQTD